MIHSTSIGLDVHARTICASALVHETGEVVRSSFGYDAASVAEWARSLPQPCRAVYESGPTGFELKRSLDSMGVPTVVGAVAKMLRPSGDRARTDRRDADFLARMLAVGNVVECWCPTPAQEADRDLSLGYGSGLRVSEVCALRVRDVDSKAMRLLVEDGKVAKDRWTVLSETSLSLLRDYWAPLPPEPPRGLAVLGALRPRPRERHHGPRRLGKGHEARRRR